MNTKANTMTNDASNMAMIKFYFMAAINWIVAVIPWALALDWVSKVVGLAFSVCLFIYTRKRYLKDMKLKHLDEEIKRETLRGLQLKNQTQE